jgi:tetratricopeptide (TPR) repeat protein
MKTLFLFFFVLLSLLSFSQDDTLLVKVAADTLSKDLQEGGISAEALGIYNIALQKAEAHKTDSAIAYFTQAISLEPKFAKAFYNRSAAYLAREDYSGALLDIDRYLALTDTASKGYFTRAVLLDKLERQEDALAAYAKAIAKEDEADKAFLAIGNTQLRNEAYQEAVDNFTAYLRYHPSDGMVLHDRGSAYQQLNDLKSAERDYRQAALVNPELATANANLGTVLRKLERYDQAVDAYSDALKVASSDAMIYNNRGYTYFLAGEFEKAVEDFKKSTELSPQYAYAHNNLASAYIKLEKYKEAVEAADKAISIDSEYGFAYLNRGIAREMIRDLKGACSDWDMAANLQVKNADDYRSTVCKYIEP